MTEKKMNGHMNYEKQTNDKDMKKVYLRRRIAVGGAALAFALATGLGINHLAGERQDRSDKQQEIEQAPSLEDQILDAIENYEADLPQIQYAILPDDSISKQAEEAAGLLHKRNNNLTYAENHQAIALTAANMAARDIENITGGPVQPGSRVTTWYDLEMGSFVTAATDALPREE